MTKSIETSNIELWEVLNQEVRELTPNQLFNKLADHEPELYKSLMEDARLWLLEALYTKLRNCD